MLLTLIGTLLTGIGSAFLSALAYFSAWSAKRILLVLAGVGAIAIAVGVFVAAVESALSSIVVAMPAELQLGFLFVPGNVSGCTTAIITVHIARWLYSLHLKVINIKVG
jgi:hypothetical protein